MQQSLHIIERLGRPVKAGCLQAFVNLNNDLGGVSICLKLVQLKARKLSMES